MRSLFKDLNEDGVDELNIGEPNPSKRWVRCGSILIKPEQNRIRTTMCIYGRGSGGSEYLA
jgi:hypothetical protein